MPSGATSPDICCVILAGGKSRRMGRNKAMLEIGGRPLIEGLAALAQKVTDEVLISSEDRTSYAFLDLTVIRDIYSEQGPLAGVHAAMAFTSRPLILALACDMPNLHLKLLNRLIECAAGYEAVVPRTADGRCHPLCSVYRRILFPLLEQNLKQGMNRFIDLIQHSSLRVKWLSPEEGHFIDSDLLNLNSPNDLVST